MKKVAQDEVLRSYGHLFVEQPDPDSDESQVPEEKAVAFTKVAVAKILQGGKFMHNGKDCLVSALFILYAAANKTP